MSAFDPGDVERVAAALRGVRSVLFITGAGLSADSGLPTYRGVGGLYEGDDTDDGVPVEVALSGAMFRTRPELTWRHILHIEKAARGARPNPGHEVIAAFEKRIDRTWVLTQNVDGLHLVAGSTKVIDIHGDVHKLYCTSCEWAKVVADFGALSALPRCPECGAVIRPDVVLFGELLPGDRLALLSEQLRIGFDAVFSVGTSSLFPYIAEPFVLAADAGRLTVEINPDDTEVSSFAGVRLRCRAADALPAIWRALQHGHP